MPRLSFLLLAALLVPASAQAQHPADVRFMRGMIGHHEQALVMTAMVPGRTEARGLRLLAERIDVSQRDEIEMMRQWLRRRGQPLPDTGAHAHHATAGDTLMPGMLTAEEIARLRAATGREFERLFLTYMIRHHEGAITMVRQLFATPGGGQESETYSFAADVEADQRAEIERMRRMLDQNPIPIRKTP